jgi:hypothetical protein
MSGLAGGGRRHFAITTRRAKSTTEMLPSARLVTNITRASRLG